MPHRLFQRARNSNNNIKEDDVILSFGLLSLQQRTQKRKKKWFYSPLRTAVTVYRRKEEKWAKEKGRVIFPSFHMIQIMTSTTRFKKLNTYVVVVVVVVVVVPDFLYRVMFLFSPSVPAVKTVWHDSSPVVIRRLMAFVRGNTIKHSPYPIPTTHTHTQIGRRLTEFLHRYSSLVLMYC